MALRTAVGCFAFAVLQAGCGGDTTTVAGGTCSADAGVLCVCPGATLGQQQCVDGVAGDCDCSNPINPGECNEDGVAAACICEDDQIGEQSCTDGVPGECLCPDAIPPEQCRTDLDCGDGVFCNGVERCNPGADNARADGCTPPVAAPTCDDGIACTVDRCSNERDRCIFEAPDADGDGHRDQRCTTADGEPLGDDCDDDDDNRYPGNLEVCTDGNFDHDEDCDGDTHGILDLDADGATDDRCCNGTNCGFDCDDTTIARRVGQPEFCDNRDNDCDGVTDEETGAVPWYTDADGDGFGGVLTMDEAISQCIPIPGRSLLPTDCNDADAGKHPAQLERCDLRDNNCNLIADDNAQCPYDPFPVAPDDDGGVNVPGGENPICPMYGFQDLDGDGFGDTSVSVALDKDAPDCGLPANWVTKSGDCKDDVASVNPGEIDVCDAEDNDCDGVVDQEPEASETCNLPNIAGMCVFGGCVIADGAMCTAPFDDCDGLVASGCETNTTTSAAHCGGCNQACSLADVCASSTCLDSPYLEIEAGEDYTLVRRGGGLIGWGRSADLQLGTGGNVLNPLRVGVVGGVTQVDAGFAFACLRQGGAVSCWGDNQYGQLGNGRLGGNDASAPVTVAGIADAVLVRGGGSHACVVRADQTVWCWGRAGSGQLGHSDSPPTGETAPVQVRGVTDAISLGMGDLFSCVLHQDTTVSCFGEDDTGRLGSDAGMNLNAFEPRPVTGLSQVQNLATGSGSNAHMCAVLTTGGVACWGFNQYGGLGNGNTTASFTPVTFQQVTNAKQVAVGYAHTCVVETDGDLWCAGADDVAQLGHPEDQGGASIAKLVDLGGERAEAVACGRRHTCALLDSGRVICFGGNQYGQVGAGNTTTSSTGVYPFRETLPAP